MVRSGLKAAGLKLCSRPDVCLRVEGEERRPRPDVCRGGGRGWKRRGCQGRLGREKQGGLAGPEDHSGGKTKGPDGRLDTWGKERASQIVSRRKPSSLWLPSGRVCWAKRGELRRVQSPSELNSEGQGCIESFSTTVLGSSTLRSIHPIPQLVFKAP